jgi:chaperone required for assembly of F1-ATPase
MSSWAPRRFWTEAAVAAEGDGFVVLLDSRPLRTPAKAPLWLPTRALAEGIAAEWRAQGETVRPDTLPLTRAANSAIDRVPSRRPAVIGEIANWAETDLLCHRAPMGDPLADRQRAAWDPILDWAADRFGARLVVTEGVIPCAQPARALAAMRTQLEAEDDFALIALSDMVALSGSLILALAARHAHLSAARAWRLSRLDEDWQAEQWGTDSEAAAAAENRHAAFLLAHRLLVLSRPDSDDVFAGRA